MIPPSFEYETPSTIDEAIELLSRPRAQVLAGGQSLIPAMKVGTVTPRLLVDIRLLKGLDGITISGGMASIGALVTQRQLEDSEELAEAVPLIREAADVVADPTVRTRGTLCGSLAYCDPSGDWPAVALALDAAVRLVGPGGDRRIPVQDLIVDGFKTSMAPAEIITHTQVTYQGDRPGAAYLKHRHPASGYALVGVAAWISLDGNDRVEACRVAVTGAGRRPVRATRMEEALRGKEPQPEEIGAAARVAGDDIELRADIDADEVYRSRLVEVYARRAVILAAGRARTSRKPSQGPNKPPYGPI